MFQGLLWPLASCFCFFLFVLFGSQDLHFHYFELLFLWKLMQCSRGFLLIKAAKTSVLGMTGWTDAKARLHIFHLRLKVKQNLGVMSLFQSHFFPPPIIGPVDIGRKRRKRAYHDLVIWTLSTFNCDSCIPSSFHVIIIIVTPLDVTAANPAVPDSGG